MRRHWFFLGASTSALRLSQRPDDLLDAATRSEPVGADPAGVFYDAPRDENFVPNAVEDLVAGETESATPPCDCNCCFVRKYSYEAAEVMKVKGECDALPPEVREHKKSVLTTTLGSLEILPKSDEHFDLQSSGDEEDEAARFCVDGNTGTAAGQCALDLAVFPAPPGVGRSGNGGNIGSQSQTRSPSPHRLDLGLFCTNYCEKYKTRKRFVRDDLASDQSGAGEVKLELCKRKGQPETVEKRRTPRRKAVTEPPPPPVKGEKEGAREMLDYVGAEEEGGEAPAIAPVDDVSDDIKAAEKAAENSMNEAIEKAKAD